MLECLKFLPSLLLFLFVACSTHVAGTTEEPNGLADNDSSSSAQSSGSGKSSSSGQPASSSSGEASELGVMYAPYWHPYYSDGSDERMIDVQVAMNEDENIEVSYKRSAAVGTPDTARSTTFGVEIRVAGEGDDVFSEMKTWTGGVCYMLTSDVQITLKMGMSPEKEKELEYDLPQATLIGPGEVGNVVLRCVSWLDFEQQGFGPTITIEEAFFDYMTSLRFEMLLENGDDEGSFEIYQMRPGGTGISADMDGMDITVDDGTDYVEQPNGN